MELLDFAGRVAVVTGAGRGIGREVALLLASRGARIVVNDLGVGSSVDGSGVEPERAAAVVAEIVAAGGTAVADEHSVADPAAAGAIIACALDAFGQVDIVVNNAGLGGADSDFANVPPEAFQRMLDVNTLGAVYVTQAAWPHFEAQHYGRVVNMCSGSMWGNRSEAAYVVSKAGLWGLTRVLADAGQDIGVVVNALLPLAFTAMAQTSMSQAKSPITNDGAWMGEWLRANSPPSLVSPLAVWLAHHDCDTNGEAFTVGGGRVARAVLTDTPGIVDPGLTPERLRDRFTEVLGDERWKVHVPGPLPRYRYHVDSVEAGRSVTEPTR